MENVINHDIDKKSYKTLKIGNANNLPPSYLLTAAYEFLCLSEKIKPRKISFDWNIGSFNSSGLTICSERRYLFYRHRTVIEIKIYPLTADIVKTLIHEFTHQILFLKYGRHLHDNRFFDIERKLNIHYGNVYNILYPKENS